MSFDFNLVFTELEIEIEFSSEILNMVEPLIIQIQNSDKSKEY